MNTTVLGGGNAVATMKWLLRREYWEHKGSMFWAPAAIAMLLVVSLGGVLGYGAATHGLPEHVWLGNQEIPHDVLTSGLSDASRTLARILTANYLLFTSPALLMLAFVSFFYCLGALYDERRDRSILFWKSLPVSDPMTVAAKAATALLLAPAIAIGVVIVSSFVLLVIVCIALAGLGINVAPAVLASPYLYLSPLSLLALLPVYAVWALPTVGWLMLVSSWARTKPLLWAVGVPLTGLVIVKWISLGLGGFGEVEHGLMHTANGIVARLLGGLMPGLWFTFDGQSMSASDMRGGPTILLNSVVASSWKSLATPDAWAGAAVGIAMLAGAARLRRWRDEG